MKIYKEPGAIERRPITKRFVKRLAMFGAVVVSGAVTYLASEIGDTNTVTIEVLFSQTVTASDFKAGVTIKNNTVTQTILSGTLQPDGETVFYVISVAGDINDALTWEYDSGLGNIVGLGDVTPQNVTNYIGSQYYFNTGECSAPIVSCGL